MSFENTIKKAIFPSKKSAEKNEEKKDFHENMEDFVKKFTIVAFVGIVGYMYLGSLDNAPLETPASSSEESVVNQDQKIQGVAEEDFIALTETKDNLANQEPFTILSPSFWENIEEKDFIFINATEDKEGEFYNSDEDIIRVIPLSKNIDTNSYESSFTFLNTRSNYIIFVDEVEEISLLKRELENSGFERVFFSIQ